MLMLQKMNICTRK